MRQTIKLYFDHELLNLDEFLQEQLSAAFEIQQSHGTDSIEFRAMAEGIRLYRKFCEAFGLGEAYEGHLRKFVGEEYN